VPSVSISTPEHVGENATELGCADGGVEKFANPRFDWENRMRERKKRNPRNGGTKENDFDLLDSPM
jgi:hypothetical protein